ncbi:hypothetical protein MB901379_04269 [Mycobacterium basiliense]|uniref:Integral membrane protein n=1 Tax=Mycobacterium basiliense TaxID=2094119 RepID=A0A3S4BL77_9MYCO|nr:DUF5134 domain-containing protein [Mycobacterium basiliense]VDM90662.1 hypothetical protein MB901379_04269 [Mycobacterium basiliense]
MIHDLTLRWLVTGLFALSAAECGVPIVTKRGPWTLVVSHGLHFLMAVAMAAMAWPWGAQSPTSELAVFFLLAAVWFATAAVRAVETRTARLRCGYYSLMMLATAWMYIAMDGVLVLTRHPQTGALMPGTNMAAMDMPATAGAPIWFSAANWLGAVCFAVAAAFWTCRPYIAHRRKEQRCDLLANLGQAAMAAGMTILFSAALFAI